MWSATRVVPFSRTDRLQVVYSRFLMSNQSAYKVVTTWPRCLVGIGVIGRDSGSRQPAVAVKQSIFMFVTCLTQARLAHRGSSRLRPFRNKTSLALFIPPILDTFRCPLIDERMPYSIFPLRCRKWRGEAIKTGHCGCPVSIFMSTPTGVKHTNTASISDLSFQHLCSGQCTWK